MSLSTQDQQAATKQDPLTQPSYQSSNTSYENIPLQ
jgi:hypothetical protein